MVRTRFAPSPTGYLHVGGARTALFNYLYAVAQKGKFILRIEDTDQARSTQQSYEQMIESLQWLGLEWDEGPEQGDFGPYHQSKRLDIYQRHADELITQGSAYRCFCSAEELEVEKNRRQQEGLPLVYNGKCRDLPAGQGDDKPHVLRFKMPAEEIIVNDLVQGKVSFDGSLIGDFVIVKSDGYASYNFAVVVDDHLMQISHVIRGVGHLSNTPRQIGIYRAFGWDEPTWVHISEIVGNDNKKLSKRHGATAVTAFRDLGYPVEAFVNFITLLGWSPPDEEEFMTHEKIVSQFDVAKCHKNPAMFDVFDLKKVENPDLSALAVDELASLLMSKSKMNHLSNLHIRAKPEVEYIDEVFPFVEASGRVPESDLKKENPALREILLSLRVYLDRYRQIADLIGDFFDEGGDFLHQSAGEWLSKEHALLLIETLHRLMLTAGVWEPEPIGQLVKEAGKEAGVKGKDLFMTVRAATTGKTTGMDLPVYIALLGKERILARLGVVIDSIK